MGEGPEDAAFVRALCTARGNFPAFDVSPPEDVGGVRGNSGFEPAVIACEPIVGFSTVSDVVILADNDDNPDESFARMVGQIEKARREGDLKRNWGRAAEPAVKANGDPSVSVWMWPSPGRTGCLETLLWDVIQAVHPDKAECAETACKCTGADGWPVSKRDKSLVRCFMSIMCRENPAIGLGLLWRDFPDLIPLDHAAFDPVSAFLAKV